MLIHHYRYSAKIYLGFNRIEFFDQNMDRQDENTLIGDIQAMLRNTFSPHARILENLDIVVDWGDNEIVVVGHVEIMEMGY